MALNLRGLLEQRFGLWTEVGIIAGVLLVWQALRIPAEGSTEAALAHARSWFSFEHDLRVAMEPSLIRFAHRVDLAEVVDWTYNNLHLTVLFAFVVGVRLLAPSYYPRVRTAYVLIHVPALIAIWAYPTAPPKWLPEIPFHEAVPTDEELTAGGGLFLNKTAALVSLHFGYSLFISLVVIRVAPRSAWAWLSLAYPAFVLFLIIGSGNHFVLDAVTGAACVGFGLLGARLLHGRASQEPQAAPTREAVVLMIAAGLLAFAIDALVAGRAVHGAWYPPFVTGLLGAALAFARVAPTRPR
jgi:PAP2 superfamily